MTKMFQKIIMCTNSCEHIRWLPNICGIYTLQNWAKTPKHIVTVRLIPRTSTQNSMIKYLQVLKNLGQNGPQKVPKMAPTTWEHVIKNNTKSICTKFCKKILKCS